MGVSDQGRLLAVGDIHGQLAKLRELMERVRPLPGERIVFLGDYIDRGPEAKGVIDFLLDFSRGHPRAIFLRGNHEAMFLDFLDGRAQELYLYNGGLRTLESYREGKSYRIPERHWQFLRGLPLCHEEQDFIFVHAGLRPGLSLQEQDPRDLLWIRGDFIDSGCSWGKTVVFGHTPMPSPLFLEGKIGLDTGAGQGGRLSCCEVRQRLCWSV